MEKVTETAVWKGEDECEITIIQDRVPVYKDESKKQIVGWNEGGKQVCMFSREELEFNLKQHLDMLKNLQSNMDTVLKEKQKVLDAMEQEKVSRVRTSELVRLEKNLKALHLITQLQRFTNQETDMQPQLDAKTEWVEQRKKTLQEGFIPPDMRVGVLGSGSTASHKKV